MRKPRVILADRDERYLASLELKFLEELSDTISLELITDAGFFETHFSEPQSIDILVVSTDLYSRDLLKHNISNILVLTEQAEGGDTDDLGITKIFKYSNVKEIYSQIIATSSGTIKAETHKMKETTVVLVYSPSGGSGKTTLALGMCACFAQSYKRVLYINAEQINTFQHWMDNQSTIPSNMSAEFTASGGNLFNRIQHIIRRDKKDSFDYLPPFAAMLPSLTMKPTIYEEIVKTAKATKEYDVIVIDTDSVFDLVKVSLITQADKVVLLLEQTKSSVFAVSMLMKNMSCDDDDKYYFVCNKFDKDKKNASSAANVAKGFTVNEHVSYIPGADALTVSELVGNPDIQKLSLLVL